MRHDESLLKPKDVAELLNVSGTWVYDASDKGLLPHRRLNGPHGPLRFVAWEIDASIEEARGGWQPGDRPQDTLSRVAL